MSGESTGKLFTGCEHGETDAHPTYDEGGQIDGCLGGVFPADVSQVEKWLTEHGPYSMSNRGLVLDYTAGHFLGDTRPKIDEALGPDGEPV